MIRVFGISCLLITISQLNSGQDLDSLIFNATDSSLVHLKTSVEEVKNHHLFPTYGTKDFEWKLDSSDQWTSGFYPGCLWYGYKLSSDSQFISWAKQWTSSLEAEKTNPNTHDLGFKFMCSYGNGLGLVNDSDSLQYMEILHNAANTLATRYNPKIGCIKSNWDNQQYKNSFPVIVDVMMNLELLLWASQNGGPEYYKTFAVSHAMKTYKDFVRLDGGTWHIVRYDSITGEIINKGTLQGQGDETTWSRGHAWTTYGMVVMFRYTHDSTFLHYAMDLSDYFIKNLEPDHVSRWDFQSETNITDASASCIIAAALFEMADFLGDDSIGIYYREKAEMIMLALCNKPYFLGGTNTSCLLDHSVHYLTINSNVDVPSIYADYYFLEALYRYKAY